MNKNNFTPKDVKKIAKLAQIPITETEEEALATGFTKTLNVVDKLFSIDVTNVEPTSQVTGQENVTREDDVDISRTFTQEQALANASRKHNGFFVVNQILDND